MTPQTIPRMLRQVLSLCCVRLRNATFNIFDEYLLFIFYLLRTFLGSDSFYGFK